MRRPKLMVAGSSVFRLTLVALSIGSFRTASAAKPADRPAYERSIIQTIHRMVGKLTPDQNKTLAQQELANPNSPTLRDFTIKDIQFQQEMAPYNGLIIDAGSAFACKLRSSKWYSGVFFQLVVLAKNLSSQQWPDKSSSIPLHYELHQLIRLATIGEHENDWSFCTQLEEESASILPPLDLISLRGFENLRAYDAQH